MSCLRGRKRCVLAEPEWKMIPWLQQEKSPRDYLLDIIAELSGIFEDLDVMKTCDNPFEKERLKQQIIDSLLQMQQDLATWQVLHAPDYEIPTKVPEEVSPQQVIGCHLMTSFWATVIVVVNNFQALWGPAREIDPIFDLDICCGNIIRSFYIIIHPAMGIFRTHLTTYPMTVAIYYIREVGPQRLVEERRILADCLCDPAIAHVRQFINSMDDDMPLEFLN